MRKKDDSISLAIDVMAHHSNGFYSTLDKEPLHKYLTFCERCPEHYFRKRGVQGISIDMKKVIDKLLSNGYAEEFLENYKRYRNCESYCNTIRKVLAECIEQKGVNHFGVKTHAIYYDVNVQQNLRFNYKNRDIVAFPKTYTNTFTTEDGYFLVWGDFAQSDFRIAFNLLLRDENNTKFMSEIDDKYEGLVYGVLRYGIGRHLLEMIANPTRMQSFRGIDLIKVFTFGIYSLDTEPTLARFFTTSLINVAIIYVVVLLYTHTISSRHQHLLKET